MAKEDEVNVAEAQSNGQAEAPAFSIEKLYIKDASVEIPNAPQIFTERETPQISIELANAAQAALRISCEQSSAQV